MPGGEVDRGRLARLVALIAFVTAVFLVTGSEALPDPLFTIGAVVTAIIAVVTAITGFLIAAAGELET